MLVFDIETGPLPDEILKERFTPKSVAEFVGKQRWKQETIDKNYAEYMESAFDEYKARAALDAASGRVLAVGFKSEKGTGIFGERDSDEGGERALLEQFWEKAVSCETSGRSLVGHYCSEFDVPFLTRRSWLLGVEPKPLKCIVDTNRVWSCGVYGERIQLGKLASALGVGAKSEGCTGADFARLWNGTDEEHEQARDYLKNDIGITWNVACRLGVL